MDVLTDEESENFINLVSKHPCLFDCKNPNYKDARIKENIWKEIAQELNKTSENCKRQWKTIRDGYMRFKRKNKLPTGSEAPKSNRTKWKLYRLLSFLDNVPQERFSISTVEDESVSSQNKTEESAESALMQQGTDVTLSEDNTQQESSSMNIGRNIPAPPTAVDRHKIIKKRPRSNRDDILSYMRERENSRQLLMKNISRTDEFKSFANHIEHVLKNLPTRLLQIKAKKEIFEVLTKYEILAADNSSTISSSSTPYTSRADTAMTSVSDDSQYTILNARSPISSCSEPADLTYMRNAEFHSIVSEANDLTHQTENEEFPSISEFLNN